jgi:DNA primase catalytic core
MLFFIQGINIKNSITSYLCFKKNKSFKKFHFNILCRFNSSLSQLISKNGIKLVQRGKSFVAICPFHIEKTPSFYIDDEKGIYHCFGCGESGNFATFIKKIRKNNLAYNRFFEYSVIYKNSKYLPIYSEKFYLSSYSTLVIIEIACKYYEKLLYNNKIGKIYFFTRGISFIISKIYRLGYSVTIKNDLSKLFISHGLKYNDIIRSGITTQKSGIFFDIFQNRLIIPITNKKGIIVGFGGRLFIASKSPKYLNSSDSPVFKKNRCMYSEFNLKNLNRIKPKIGVLVEGYMDSLILIQNGIRFSTASLGTGISKHHLQRAVLLSKNNHIIFCLDNDKAGREASKKILLNIANEVKKNQLKISISSLGKFKDPDEFTYFRGSYSFIQLVVNTSKPGIIWLENFFYTSHLDFAFYINYVTYEFVFVLSKFIENKIVVDLLKIFVKSLLGENQIDKIKMNYFFQKNNLEFNRIVGQMIEQKKKKIYKLFEKKKKINDFKSRYKNENFYSYEKKIIFILLFLNKIGNDISYNNISCLFYFSDYSKFMFQTQKNFSDRVSHISIFEYYWDDFFLDEKNNQIFIKNIDMYFLKNFNINKAKIIETKITTHSIDHNLKQTLVHILIDKRGSLVKNLSKIIFLEKKINSKLDYFQNEIRNSDKKMLIIFLNRKKKKLKLLEQLGLEIIKIRELT